MARIRSNNVFGTTTDNPLTAGATTMNSAGLANLAAVTGSNTAIITLDPGRVAGAPEIVIVTAHTGSATSATITRGAFGTTARQHASGTAWEHAPIAVQPPANNSIGDWLSMDPPSCRAYRSSSQTGIVTATVTTILLDSESHDTDSMHSTVSNTGRVTFNTGGLYAVHAGVGIESNATGVRVAWLALNGSDASRIVQSGVNAVNGDVTDLTLSTIYKFAAGDYVELHVYQTSGANRATATLQQPFISATWLGTGD